MGFVNNMRQRYVAMKLGAQIMGEGMGFKGTGSGGGGILGAIQQALANRWSEPPKRDTEAWLKMFGTNPRLSPAYKIAEDVGGAEYGLYTKDSKGELSEMFTHPALDLFHRPNPLPDMTWFNLLFMTEAYLLLRGEAFWIKERNGLRTPTELWPVPPHWIMSIPTVYEPFFKVQVLNGSGAVMNVPPEDMLYFKEPDLLNPYGRGQGRAQGIDDEVETDEYMAKFAKKFFFNDARPPFIITAPGAQKTDTERMEQSWNEKQRGLNNAHKPAFLPFDGKVTELGKSQKDMDFIEGRKFLRDVSNQHFRVPPELMAIIENSNRATIDAADYIYRSGTLKNRLRRMQDAIQRQLIESDFDARLIFKFKNVVPEDKAFKLEQANAGLANGSLSMNEWRKANEWEDYSHADGNFVYVPSTAIPTADPLGTQEKKESLANTTAANRLRPQPGGTTAPKPEKPLPGAAKPKPEKPGAKPKKHYELIRSMTPEQKDAFAQLFDETLIKREDKLQPVVSKFFDKQSKRALKKLNTLLKDYTPSITKDDNVPDDNGISDKLLAWGIEDADLLELIAPYLLDSINAGAIIADGEFDLGVSFDLLRPEMLEWIQEQGAEKVVGINETTKFGIRDAVAEGVKAGEGASNIAARVREVFSEASRIRSFTIARTESHNTMVHGAMRTYQEAGIRSKQWLAVGDDRTRPTHVAVNGEVKPMDEKFSNGCDYPGSGPAQETINCRCALLPVLDE